MTNRIHPNALNFMKRLPKTGIYKAATIEKVTSFKNQTLRNWTRLYGFPAPQYEGKCCLYDCELIWQWINKTDLEQRTSA